MKKRQEGGFTLIELLVVIVIIGILTTVVLVSLSSARNKGADAAIKRDLSAIMTQANIYYNGAGNNTYGSSVATCNAGMYSADTAIAAALTHATTQASGSIACNATSLTFAVAATMRQTSVGYFCVDSANVSKVISPSVATSGLVGAGSTYALNTTTGLCS